VRVGQQRYIIPVLTVAESILPTADMLNTVVGRGEMLSLRGNLLPLFRLSRLLGVTDAVEDVMSGVVVVVESGTQRAGLLVDELLGQQQTVIKTLSSALGKTAGLSGATIMPDGKVGLILDVTGIVQLAHSQN
jgi:two-component system chemotaxis sensor kinase CheA